jgi:hypothetical protein
MNPRTVAARSAPLSFVAAKKDHTSEANFPDVFPDLCSLAMDQALGIEKESLAPASNSGSQDQTTPDELAYSMDITLGERFTAPGSTVATSSGIPAQPKAEELAQSMDVAIGERFAAPSSIVPSSLAITPSRKRRVGERFGNRYRGAGGRLNLSYGSRKAHG